MMPQKYEAFDNEVTKKQLLATPAQAKSCRYRPKKASQEPNNLKAHLLVK